MTKEHNRLALTGAEVGSAESVAGKPGLRLTVPGSMQRVILAIGFAILVVISTASIALDVKSRSDAAWVRHTLEALNKLADVRLSFRRAESASRAYLLTNDRYFREEYRLALGRITPAFAGLKEMLVDNPTQRNLLDSSEPIVTRRFALTDEANRLAEADDTAAIAALTAKGEGRELMEVIDASFEQLATEERRLLEVRTEASEITGRQLMAIDLCCSVLILLLAAILTMEGLRFRRQQGDRQRAAESANESLEAAVAERTEHLLVAHEELRLSTSTLSSTFASMAEAVLVVDNAGEIVLSNFAAEQMLHYQPGMTTAQLWTQNVTCQSDGLTQVLADERLNLRVLRGEQLDGVEIAVRRSGGSDPIQLVVSGRSLRDASEAICGGVLVFRDVTAARETERKLRQSQRLDAIGKLTGGVAHDFNNMLTVICGTTEILVDKLQGRPDLQAVAALIDQAADRCAELIQHLLAFASKQPLHPRNVNVDATVTDIVNLLRPTLGEHIEIESILGREVAPARVDPSQLANALINLAINARDAMPDGGKLRLEISEVLLDEAYAESHADVRPGAYVLLTVSDTGIGMSADLRDKVFEPFFTTKDAGKGTGLGLSMVYGFAKQSGGHIKIHSEPNLGTSIKLYLPVATGEADSDVLEAKPVQGAGETILVVEDDTLVRDFVIAQLHSLGYGTASAADGQAALALLESGRSFDLVFTDVVLPGGITGPQLADEIKKSWPATKVLYTSGYTENAAMNAGRLDRGVMLLSKPYSKSELAGMVRLALGDGAASSRAWAIPPADTSIVIPMRRLPAGGQALSSG